MMKFFKKVITYAQVVGTMVLTSNCTPGSFKTKLIEARVISGFPSASAIEYDEGKFFVFGDDAPYMLVLDSLYRQIDTVRFLPDTNYRLPKQTKPDIESATIVTVKGEKILYALGSFSGEKRNQLFTFPLRNIHENFVMDVSHLYKQPVQVTELNIEGLAIVGETLVMSNRANKSTKINQLIIQKLIHQNPNLNPHVINLTLEGTTIAGVSGLFYNQQMDMLLITASVEDTPNAMDDGLIDGSYLGWISGFSSKMKEADIQPTVWIRLSSIDPQFEKQKIESVCVQHIIDGIITLHLVADNDNGQSTLFKMQLKP